MAVTSKTLRSTQRTRVVAARPAAPPLRMAASLVTMVLAALAAAAVINLVAGHARIALDDLRYGRPRTTHIDGFVGHNEASGQPTHLTALNLNRQVVVVELPGGDASQARTIVGPYLFGAQEDLTPVLLDLRDMDGDAQADLVVEVRQEQIVYLNRDGSFRLPTADERARLEQDHHP
ncbi:MAG TPA: hypothetical protein VFS21_32415 [Roseiflexaceae bacterium]|nr:hypothetical protein [Roseiflexaceae bacterium]